VLLKEIITSDRVLQHIGPKLTIKLSPDANKDGLDALILQLHESTLKPVAYASRAMTNVEKNCA